MTRDEPDIKSFVSTASSLQVLQVLLKILSHPVVDCSSSDAARELVDVLMKVRRAAEGGLETAIAAARASGITWRELSSILDTPVATLHRHYRDSSLDSIRPGHGSPTDGCHEEPLRFDRRVPAVPAVSWGRAPKDIVLTTREAAIARLVAEGKTNRVISSELFISIGTTNQHLANIYRKLALKSRAELAYWVARNLHLEST
jgi:DNA-binding NarL/FixJ family response regulator